MMKIGATLVYPHMLHAHHPHCVPVQRPRHAPCFHHVDHAPCSVVDREGGAVSLTTTVNGPFGSGLVSESTGLLLNNEMDDFSKPGAPNMWGLAPSRG